MATARYSRVRRHFQDDQLDVSDWNEQRAELIEEQEGALAEVARLKDREQAEADAMARVNTEDAVAEHLSAIRARCRWPGQ